MFFSFENYLPECSDSYFPSLFGGQQHLKQQQTKLKQQRPKQDFGGSSSGSLS